RDQRVQAAGDERPAASLGFGRTVWKAAREPRCDSRVEAGQGLARFYGRRQDIQHLVIVPLAERNLSSQVGVGLGQGNSPLGEVGWRQRAGEVEALGHVAA